MRRGETILEQQDQQKTARGITTTRWEIRNIEQKTSARRNKKKKQKQTRTKKIYIRRQKRNHAKWRKRTKIKKRERESRITLTYCKLRKKKTEKKNSPAANNWEHSEACYLSRYVSPFVLNTRYILLLPNLLMYNLLYSLEGSKYVTFCHQLTSEQSNLRCLPFVYDLCL